MVKSQGFPKERSLEQRQEESKTILTKYPDRIPVIIERYSRTDLPDIDKNKFLVPRDMSVGQFIHILSSRLKLSPGRALFVFVNNTLPRTDKKTMTLGTPPSSQAYGEPWYWDNRYAHEPAPFDWYQKYSALAPLIRLYVPHRHQRVLVVGCGNSVFSEDMVNDGYEDVVNVDISNVVIEAMQAKYSNRQQLKYIKLDVRDMSPFQAGSFDAVIDKGTLDSILCGNNSRQNAAQMLDEVSSAADYVWISGISSQLAERFVHVEHKTASKFGPEGSSEQQVRGLTDPIPLDESGSSVEDVLGKNPEVHYIYVCTKVKGLDQDRLLSRKGEIFGSNRKRKRFEKHNSFNVGIG
ncbi:hypothetical protein V6N13_047745 [Hibiscus sabdariffa]